MAAEHFQSPGSGPKERRPQCPVGRVRALEHNFRKGCPSAGVGPLGRQSPHLPGGPGALVPGQRTEAGSAWRARHSAACPVPLYLGRRPSRWRTTPFLSQSAGAREARQCGRCGGDAQAVVAAQLRGPPRNSLGAAGRVGQPASYTRQMA